MSYFHRNECRVCKKGDLTRILSLGEHPPVDNFIEAGKEQEEMRYPLDVYFCNTCSLVQLLDIVEENELFHGEYAYFSSSSKPLVDHFSKYADDLKKRHTLKSDDLLVDIGSNDGVLLQFFTDTCRVLGIEPSANVADIAREKGIETLDGFFTEKMAKDIVEKHGQAKIITANNVFAHIDDLDEIVRGVKVLLSDDGVFVTESHYLLDLIEHMEFDTVYHEHLCYYSVKPLCYLFERFDMEVSAVERVATHGGSIRVFARKKMGKPIESSVAELLSLEEQAGIHSLSRFVDFQKDAEALRDKLVSVVRGFRKEGKKVTAYGAPAKGNTLLNFCGFTGDDIAYVTDTTPYKIGRLTPGSHIPVVSPDILKTETPDHILLLAWNYRDFILDKETELRKRGAQFIIPIPKVEIV
ncbi:SAM-dependent methyltransferase [Candidatus Kaiserbacteria bacterium CG10_big_fil_rev_8_21_14_0_10_47_16]|uniref:SAM-dependent methyltransferase n=1 Tax=Candidatus Kaiserbacteria bacterium CG10_big_fil_rev_8_21_14_0_10_47_16 TaxID=1974608 RepID=A0A2H0UER6_9BACT|nr:MAG: SAM-dependent methyltransferase [Candidatus Kaiserbacteria bacterium CG10_big_fil_rev_8_21_14_0_10_47_16]